MLLIRCGYGFIAIQIRRKLPEIRKYLLAFRVMKTYDLLPIPSEYRKIRIIIVLFTIDYDVKHYLCLLIKL